MERAGYCGDRHTDLLVGAASPVLGRADGSMAYVVGRATVGVWFLCATSFSPAPYPDAVQTSLPNAHPSHKTWNLRWSSGAGSRQTIPPDATHPTSPRRAGMAVSAKEESARIRCKAPLRTHTESGQRLRIFGCAGVGRSRRYAIFGSCLCFPGFRRSNFSNNESRAIIPRIRCHPVFPRKANRPGYSPPGRSIL